MYDNSVNFLGSSWEYSYTNTLRSHFFIISVNDLGKLSTVKFIKRCGVTCTGIKADFYDGSDSVFFQEDISKLSLVPVEYSATFSILVLNWAKSMDDGSFHYSSINNLVDKFMEYRETGDEASLLTSTKN